MGDKPHPLLLGAALTLALAGVARAKDTLGVPLPAGAEQLDRTRFRSPSGYRATVRWLERALARRGLKVRFEPAVDLPEVIAAHAASPDPATRWSGVNVSEYGGSVKIFIIERR